MTSADREKLKRTFDRDPELYDQARPVIQNKFSTTCLLSPASAPRLLYWRSDAALARLRRPLRRGRTAAPFPRVEVVTSAFESWDPRELVFDMVFAASSWHWLNAEVRYEKAARLLKPSGALAILSCGHHTFPDGFDPFFTEIQSCYEGLGEPRLDWPPPRPDQVPDQREEIEQSGVFKSVEIKRYVWTVDYSADSYIDLLNTYSGHIAWPQWKRDKLHREVRKLIGERPEGRIRKHYLNILYVSRLVP